MLLLILLVLLVRGFSNARTLRCGFVSVLVLVVPLKEPLGWLLKSFYFVHSNVSEWHGDISFFLVSQAMPFRRFLRCKTFQKVFKDFRTFFYCFFY